MTEPDRTDSSEPAPQPVTEEGTDGINLEDAEKKASADYQERLEEFDNIDTTPVQSAPAPEKAGKVEIPKP